MDVEAGVRPGENALGPFRAEKLPADEEGQDLTGKDLSEPRVVDPRDLMEDARLVHDSSAKTCAGPLPKRGRALRQVGLIENAWAASSKGVIVFVGTEDEFLAQISLEPGKKMDLVLCDVPGYMSLAYEAGRNPVHTVIESGRVVVADGRRVGAR